jgi:hypothetical protein
MPSSKIKTPQSKKRRGFLRRWKDKKGLVINGMPDVPAKVHSMGAGTLSPDGNALLQFQATPKSGDSTTSRSMTSEFNFDDDQNATCLKTFRNILPDPEKIRDNIERVGELVGERMERITERLGRAPRSFTRLSSSFIRVADLQLNTGKGGADSPTTDDDESLDNLPNFHHASQDPPPGVDHDPKEEWIALDDGDGSAAPIAPYAVSALADFGYKTAMDNSMWKSEGKTDRIMSNSTVWKDVAWQESGLLKVPEDFDGTTSKEVMVWSGNFIHGLYGSDLPAVRSSGIVNMSPRKLTELMVDSSRCKEYNKMSVGRTDLLVLEDNLFANSRTSSDDCSFGKSITKVMRAETLPPLVRKPLQLVTLLHVRALPNNIGFLIVSRAVTQASEVGNGFDTSLRSEILMGVNVIRGVEGQPDKCLMTNVNHMRTPMIPLFLGKKLGLAAAPNFIRDLRIISDVSSKSAVS